MSADPPAAAGQSLPEEAPAGLISSTSWRWRTGRSPSTAGSWPGPRGRRGRKIDPEWAQRNRLLRAGESFTHDDGNSISEFWRGVDGCADGRVAVFLADEVENAGVSQTVGYRVLEPGEHESDRLLPE